MKRWIQELWMRIAWYLGWPRFKIQQWSERRRYLEMRRREEGIETARSGTLAALLFYLGLPFFLLWRVLVWITTLSVDFGRRAISWEFFAGVPALLTTLIVFLITLNALFVAPQKTVSLYRAAIASEVRDAETRFREETENSQDEETLAAAQKKRADAYKVALLWYQRLQQMEGNLPEHRYGAANAAAQSGDMVLALSIMNKLAPPDEDGYGKAHLWLARALLSDPKANEESRKRAIAHLQRATRDEPNSVYIHAMLADTYLSLNLPEEAELPLRRAATQSPDYQLKAAMYYKLHRKDLVRSREYGEQARDNFRRLFATDPENHRARISYVQTLVFLQQFSTAEQVLRDAVIMYPKSQYAQLLGWLYSTWIANLETDVNVNPHMRLQLLEKGLQANPHAIDLITKLVEMSTEESEPGQRSREMLQKVLTEGKTPTVTHLAMGLLACHEENWESAQHHFELAYKLDPKMVIVANNLAWVLANQQKNPDLDRALKLIDSALERVPYPQNALMLDTRGMIYAKMGKWSESLDDLQRVLQVVSDRPETHQTLAEVYSHLGDNELASVHRQRAEELSRRSTATNANVSPR